MASKETSVTDSIYKASAKNLSSASAYLHGAAVIDENGTETPITEQMIQTACNKLIRDWETSLSLNH